MMCSFSSKAVLFAKRQKYGLLKQQKSTKSEPDFLVTIVGLAARNLGRSHAHVLIRDKQSTYINKIEIRIAANRMAGPLEGMGFLSKSPGSLTKLA